MAFQTIKKKKIWICAMDNEKPLKILNHNHRNDTIRSKTWMTLKDTEEKGGRRMVEEKSAA